MRVPHSVCLFLTGVVFAALLTPEATVAQGFSWPDKPENVQVLPDTIGPEMLSRTMRGMTSALGVRCQYCHVGEAGMSLAEFDFAADDKGTKKTAREMLRMVRYINTEVIGNLADVSGAVVTCFTCHQGQTTPPPQLHTYLLGVISEDGVGTALERYDLLHSQHYGTGVYNFGPRTFTRVADRLLKDEMPDDALVILNRGAEEHPDDFLIQFYTAQSFLAKEDTVLARIYLEKAITRNPEAGWLRNELSALPSH